MSTGAEVVALQSAFSIIREDVHRAAQQESNRQVSALVEMLNEQRRMKEFADAMDAGDHDKALALALTL